MPLLILTPLAISFLCLVISNFSNVTRKPWSVHEIRFVKIKSLHASQLTLHFFAVPHAS